MSLACSGGEGDSPDGASGGSGGASGGSGGEMSGTGGDASGGATPGAGGSTESGGTGGEAAGGGGGLGGEGGVGPGFPDPNCGSTTEIVAGRNYGDYATFAVRLDLSAPVGEYTIRVRTGDEGRAAVFRGDTQVGEYTYDPTTSLEDNQDGTVAFPDLFEIDLRSTAQADLSALDESIFDGCHTITVSETPLVAEGAEYGPYTLVDLVIDDEAAAGIYTFYAESGNSGQVELRLDGEPIDTLDYDWMTTVGGGETFRFDFPGTVAFTIERPMGTSNLFGLADLLFDGRNELVVE